jgi:hypothetical protein
MQTKCQLSSEARETIQLFSLLQAQLGFCPRDWKLASLLGEIDSISTMTWALVQVQAIVIR